MSDDLTFSEEDRVLLGQIAETARGFLYESPTRGVYDAWHGAILGLKPINDNGVTPVSRIDRTSTTMLWRA